jgi:HAD superfamily phosphoserine phosphatase-like hydrolase
MSRSKKEYRSIADDFFRESGKDSIIPEMMDLVSNYRARGITTVMITAQNDVIASPFHEHIGTDALIANRFAPRGNGYGAPVKPYCFGKGKIELAIEYSAKRKTDLVKCAFYSDSINDLPMLNVVGFPVVIKPDRLLEKEAQERGWDIIHFEKPLKK